MTKKMKKLKILISIFGFVFCNNARSENMVTVCLTGKIEEALPSYKNDLLNSVNLAVSQNNFGKKIILKNYFYDSAPLSPLRAYDAMINDRCSAIIGFEYLSDLLLIIKAQKNTKIPIFTSYPSSNDSDYFPDNILITMPSYDYQANKMIDFLNRKFGKIKRALLITEINRIDLFKYKKSYLRSLKKMETQYDEFDFLENDKEMENKLKNFIKTKNYEYVFVLSGAVGSTKIVNIMNDHKIKFIGTENFGSSSIQSLYSRLNDKNVSAFIIRHMDFLKNNAAQKKFQKDYFDRYRIMPIQFGIYAFDSINIILKTIEQKRAFDLKNLLKTNFEGVTGSSIKNGKFHRSNHYVILSIQKEGFALEE